MTHRDPVDRRTFLGTAAATTAATALGAARLPGAFASETSASAETLVGRLYETLNDRQRKEICFAWDHRTPNRGLLRNFVANNWNITKPEINDDFYTAEQRQLIREVFESIIDPSWHERYDRQLNDDAGGFGNEQSIAIFGKPGEGKFEFVMTGRHMTLRCDGDSNDHVAFGGPIFYGHAPEFNENPEHTDNVFWHQAVSANRLYQMLDGKQQQAARVANTPADRMQSIRFRGRDGRFTGVPVGEMSSDQREHLQEVLQTLIEPYRQTDRDEVVRCLKTQGGLDACHLSFYTDNDIGNDQVWDNWRLEGPSFVWHYRGAPHVHVWLNVAETADAEQPG